MTSSQSSATALNIFGIIALLEGISFILLVFVAMPLKYFADLPIYVRIVGSAHGALFVAYVIMLFYCHSEYKWSLKRSALLFLASLIPFAPFYVERKLKREAESLKTRA
ncbi:DUF3817 domain-containing protein [Olivibacter sitiensis]|uniref:DUF3817 domain-containing protein n=1 Tax=Olivibacter sitiensis TaxID=376470 RepID=UPI00041ABCAC|nr:DUF3817 domain-containing protein [Olivibacter sitiensis]